MVKNLRKLRVRCGITLLQQGRPLGVSQQSVHANETKDGEPSIATLCAIADFFNTPIDCLVGRAPNWKERDGKRKMQQKQTMPSSDG